ncbi:MAG: hypothetical protein WCV67_15345 [Victivallaceae bacterium]|jgi:hypothetical protein
MAENTERRMAANCREKSLGRPFCFSVSHVTMKANKLTRQGAEVLLMNNANKNNQSTKNTAGLKTAVASSCYALSKLSEHWSEVRIKGLAAAWGQRVRTVTAIPASLLGWRWSKIFQWG